MLPHNCPLVSIIVPVYRTEKYLDQCLNSLINQTQSNIEIILVDDGSPDNCPAICDAWAAQDSRIQVIHKANGGLSDARNAGIKVATGTWLCFIDSDDIVSVHLIDTLLHAATSDDILAVTAFSRFRDKKPKDISYDGKFTNYGKHLIQCRGGLFCWATLYNCKLVKKIDLWFDSSLRNIEDVVWNGIYLRYVKSVQFVSTPMYYYRVNPESITSRCIDRQWQVSSWIAARRSLLNWFSDKKLTRLQKKEVRGMFRHCQNNLHAECLVGNIDYQQLRNLESIEHQNHPVSEAKISLIERTIKNSLPRIYFEAYLLALRLRNTLRK